MECAPAFNRSMYDRGALTRSFTPFKSTKVAFHGHFIHARTDVNIGPQKQRTWSATDDGHRRHEWQRDDLHVVLVNPQIPQNAGNVARTCAATSIALHLVAPMGFELDNRKLKRAGLDYWDQVAIAIHPSWQEFFDFIKSLPGRNKLIAFSKFGTCHYATEGLYRGAAWDSTWLLFGAETTGLPPEAHAGVLESGGTVAKIPMANFQHVRSLNLATSVGIGVFEALRQLDGAVLPENMDRT